MNTVLFTNRKADVETHLNAIGTSSTELTHHVEDAAKKAADFASTLNTRTVAQATYDMLTNVPCGVLHAADATPETALRAALVLTIGQYLQWNITDAVNLCADILDDVNAHDLAKQVRAL